MEDILRQLATQIAALGGIIATIAFICLGIKAILTFHKGGGLREILSGAGMIFLGLMLIGAAGILVGAIQAMVKSFN